MVKNRLDYKLVNLVLLVLIIYLIYQTRSFWIGVVSILSQILLPFLIAFIIAYALNPIVQWLVRHKMPKVISMFLVIGSFLGIFGFIIYLISPVFVDQIGSIFNGIISFLKELSLEYNVEFSTIQDQLSSTFNNTLEKLGSYISNGAINIIGISVSIISKIFIIFAAMIYFLADMEKIKERVKKYLFRKSKKLYRYCALVDNELTHYLSGFIKIVLISFVEYTLLYFIIGHPNALMLGTLAGVGNLIPYFGGIITNIIAAITAFVISPELFIKTIIVFIIFSAIDGYVINPFVYGKTNKIHPLVVIVSVFAGGILFGITGIILSLPVAIIIIATIKFFKVDISRFSRKNLSIKLYK